MTVEDFVRSRSGLIAVLGLVTIGSPAIAQHAPATEPLESIPAVRWTAAATDPEVRDSLSATRAALERSRIRVAPDGNRGRNAILGGLIGAVTGLIACTVISNIANDPGTGFSTCTSKGYLMLGLGGGGLGALIGALIK